MKQPSTFNRRRTDLEGEMNVVQSINAPISVFQFYKELALAQFGDSTKKQHHFRRALMEYLENHKSEFDKVVTDYRKMKA